MDKDTVNKIFEDISKAIIFSDLSDKETLSIIHGQLDEVKTYASNISRPELVTGISYIQTIVADIVKDDAKNPEEAFDLVSRGIQALQTVLVFDRKISEVDMPAEILAEIKNQQTVEKEIDNIKDEKIFAEIKNELEAIAEEELNKEKSSLGYEKNEDEVPETMDENVTNDILDNNEATFLDDPDMVRDFIIEAGEHLEAAENSVLAFEKDPKDADAINKIFGAFHSIKGVAGFLALNDIRTLAHESENLLSLVRSGTLVITPDSIDVILASVDALKTMLQGLDGALSSGKIAPQPENVPGIIKNIQTLVAGEELLASDKVAKNEDKSNKEDTIPDTSSQMNSTKTDENKNTETNNKHKATIKEAVKIDAERLDRLLDTIGELVIAESVLSQSIEDATGSCAKMSMQLSHLDKITRELQEMATSLRMIPIKPLFQKMARLVRDLGRKSGKAVEFKMSGEDTELDKGVVDLLGDPLVHILRNAVDHGLEKNAEDRKKNDKNPTGTVELKAYHQGGNIVIEIRDDGRGLNKEAILKKALEKNLITENDNLSEQDIYNLIFKPGFSTAEKVTDVSGRGVGMDVVKRNINSLRGNINITSAAGKGSVFTLRLPLTMAIIDGMVTRTERERYIIPTLSIVRTIQVNEKDIATVLKRGEMLVTKERNIPLFRLSSIFEIEHSKNDKHNPDSLIIIVENAGEQIGLIADELLGQQQIVIKNLGNFMEDVPGIAGGTIMPDGQVGLIVDIGKIANMISGGQVNTKAA